MSDRHRRLRRLASLLLPLALTACAGPAPRAAPSTGPTATADLSGLEPAAATEVQAALGAGRSVAFVFWQTWCVSCRREAPSVVAAAARNADAILFVGVVPGRDDVVDAAEVSRTVTEWSYDFPQARDRDLSLSRALGVNGTPSIIVVGPDRKVRYASHELPADWGPLRGAPAALGPPGECPGGVCPMPD